MPNIENRTAVLALRIIQFCLAIIVLGLSAYVVDWWSGWYHAYSPSEVNFLLFCAIWTLLALLYLILVPWRFSETKMHHKFAILGVEALTMIFWFAGFIALATFLTNRECFGSVCSAGKAADVFAAFAWLAFAITTTMACMHVLQSHKRNDRGKADPNFNVRDEGV